MSRATDAARRRPSREASATPAVFRLKGAIGLVQPADVSWFRTEAGCTWVGVRRATPTVWLSAEDLFATVPTPARPQSTTELAEGLAKLKKEVDEAQRKLDALLRPHELELRNVPREQAKDEILDYFIDHGRSYPSDAARALRLDPLLVVELCDELEQEGLIGD